MLMKYKVRIMRLHKAPLNAALQLTCVSYHSLPLIFTIRCQVVEFFTIGSLLCNHVLERSASPVVFTPESLQKVPGFSTFNVFFLAPALKIKVNI